MVCSAPASRRGRLLAHPIDRQLGEFTGYARDVRVFFPVPTRCCVAHAQDRQRRQTRIQIGTKFSLRDALLDDILEDALELARYAANAPTALARQILALIQEDLDEVGPINERG